jgi:hypothetical protein
MIHKNLEQLNKIGWTEFHSINKDEELIKIAKSLGEILIHPNGKKIDYLKPKTKSIAIKNTFSYNFGLGEFPFHTDTAFWEQPAKYVLLSNGTLSKTATTIITYDQLLKLLTPLEISELKKSIFLVKTPSRNFYTSIINGSFNREYIRYDNNCMKPINKSAILSIGIIQEKLNKISPKKISWDNSKVLLLDNWRTFHGREFLKEDEIRILKRIYIK